MQLEDDDAFADVPDPDEPEQPTEEQKEKEEPKYAFPDLPHFVSHLTKLFPRQWGNDVQWCCEWWLHEEGVFILDLLWRSWEHYRLEDMGMMTWAERAYPMYDKLLSTKGPFAGCEYGRNGQRPLHSPSNKRLPIKQAPTGMFKRYETESGL